MLHWSQLNKPPRTAAGVNMPDMGLQLRAGSSVLRLPAFQEEVVTQVRGRVLVGKGRAVQLRAGSSVLRLPAFQEEVVTQVGRRGV